MRHIVRQLAGLVVVSMVLLLSCASPFLESARDPKGLSGGLGAVAVGSIWDLPQDPDQHSTHIMVIPTATARYRFHDGLSLSLSGGAGYSRGSSELTPIPDSQGCCCASAALGAKLPMGERNALELNLGAIVLPLWNVTSVAPTANLTAFHDLSDFCTVSASIGFPMVVGLCVAVHPRIGKHIVTHFSLATTTIVPAGLGVGFDVVGDQGN